IAELLFPVTLAAEVTGTVVLRDSRTGEREIGGVRVALVSPEGNVVVESVSSFDGFFEILGIQPGTYRIQVHPEQTATSGLRSVEERVLELKRGDVVDRVRVVITR
ncbi:MAG TPA: carboxypeptidase-like regulatory domain-containing protein, partial [Thermoanaerobaculia bacterium]